VLGAATIVCAQAPSPPAAPVAKAAAHRHRIGRTFPPGALAGLSAATKARVTADNASLGVRSIQSCANADQSKTHCIDEGPRENAVRAAATLNRPSADNGIEVPVMPTAQRTGSANPCRPADRKARCAVRGSRLPVLLSSFQHALA